MGIKLHDDDDGDDADDDEGDDDDGTDDDDADNGYNYGAAVKEQQCSCKFFVKLNDGNDQENAVWLSGIVLTSDPLLAIAESVDEKCWAAAAAVVLLDAVVGGDTDGSRSIPEGMETTFVELDDGDEVFRPVIDSQQDISTAVDSRCFDNCSLNFDSWCWKQTEKTTN